MLRKSPPELLPPPALANDDTYDDRPRSSQSTNAGSLYAESAEPSSGRSEGASEMSPLLGPQSHRSLRPEDLEDIESQKPRKRARYTGASIRAGARNRIRGFGVVMNPKTWNKKTIWENAVMSPIRCLPAVIVGLLLNILDALSYGESPLSTIAFSLLTVFKA